MELIRTDIKTLPLNICKSIASTDRLYLTKWANTSEKAQIAESIKKMIQRGRIFIFLTILNVRLSGKIILLLSVSLLVQVLSDGQIPLCTA
jgi:hypothetical protein